MEHRQHTDRRQDYIDPCLNCGANDCYWYGRTLEERKQRNRVCEYWDGQDDIYED